jgi:small subunit ribosomal protein S14
MTSKDFTKVFNQLDAKPGKKVKYIKHNSPKKRETGRIINKCSFCGNTRGFIGKYGLNICRRCFRLNATKLGFKKFN